MAKKNECVFVPKVFGDPSEMYLGLLNTNGKFKVPKSLANYYYALYLSSDAPNRMDAAGYKRNSQGQHSAADVYKYFGIKDVMRTANVLEDVAAENFGITVGKVPVNFNYKDAFAKAEEINATAKGWVAKVVQIDDNFQVVLNRLDARTQMFTAEVKRAMAMWQALDNQMDLLGINLDDIASAFPNLVNPLTVTKFLNYASNLHSSNAVDLNVQDIRLLMKLNAGNPIISTLMSRKWGNEEESAAKMYDILHNPSNYAASTVKFVTDSLDALKVARRTDLIDMNDVINKTILPSFNRITPEVKIQETLDKLHSEFKINSTVIVRTSKDIQKLSDAAAEALLVLERQLRTLSRQEGRTAQGKELEQLKDQLVKDIAKGKTYLGLLSVLSKAASYAEKVENILKDALSTAGNGVESSFKSAAAVSKAKTFLDAYTTIVNALSNASALKIDESLTTTELQALEAQAQALKNAMNGSLGRSGIRGLMNTLAKQATIDVAADILGDDAINGEPIANIVQMASADSSLMDFLYSCERVSDPMVSVLGTVIRDAQRDRDIALRDISEQIRRSRKNLRDAGHKDESFMYEAVDEIDYKGFNKAREKYEKQLKKEGLNGIERAAKMHEWDLENTEEVEEEWDDGKTHTHTIPRADLWTTTRYYIKSEYDWSAFNDARNLAYRMCLRKGLKGFALQDEMEKWENNNTDEVVVDRVTGRTERLPSSEYKKLGNFQERWDDAQKKYYSEMMSDTGIKGRIGSLLPAYAQKQYLPPQRRATWTEIVRRGIEGHLSAREVARNLLDRMSPIKIREDDTTYAQNGIVPQEFQNAYSSYDDTVLRQIPVYMVNPLSNQSDLTFNFDAGIQALAATAVNYDAMFKIKDIVDTMADVLLMRGVADPGDGDDPRIDTVQESAVIKDDFGNKRSVNIAVAKYIRKIGDATNTRALIDGMIEKHLYNKQLAEGQTKAFWRAVQAIINYTSINNLAPNLKGAFSNYLVGEAQMLIESVGNEFYNPVDYTRAHLIMFGNGVGKSNVMDHIFDEANSLGHLLEEKFDPLQDVYTELGGKEYLTGVEKIVGGFNIMGLYSAGESLIHLTNMYAVLCHEKVKIHGEKKSLYDAFEREVVNGTARLKIKDGVTDLDGNALTDEYIQEVQNKIRYVNQKTHGSMNAEDKGLIHRHMIGRSVLNFRQWMVEHYSRRYRGRYFDGSTRTWQEGYWNTMGKFALHWLEWATKTDIKSAISWKDMDSSQRANVRRAIAETALYGILFCISHFVLGDPKEHKGDWGYRFLIYQVRRLILDTAASVPTGLWNEGITMLQNPIAAVNTVNNFLYPVLGLGDITKEYERGRHKGENKYLVKLKKNVVPFYKQIDQLIWMADEEDSFKIFDSMTLK